MRREKIFTVILALCAITAVAQTYNVGDIAAINNLIENNGLNWDKAPTDGSSVPSSWNWTLAYPTTYPEKGVEWSSDE
ncbi:MAG: hypothetical protein LBR50_07960, partial [Tannerella sp.]|nr:hypothetical protein [Tannerella sp.]